VPASNFLGSNPLRFVFRALLITHAAAFLLKNLTGKTR
jgi:hypothetical protein